MTDDPRKLADELRRERGNTLGLNGTIRLPIELLTRIEAALRQPPTASREAVARAYLIGRDMEKDSIEQIREYRGETWLKALEKADDILATAPQPSRQNCGEQPRVTDNDAGEVTVTFGGKGLRGWSYASDNERRVKMTAAREYVEGWCDGRGA